VLLDALDQLEQNIIAAPTALVCFSRRSRVLDQFRDARTRRAESATSHRLHGHAR
jgi:hypothetical protein